jgi:hypothetical protein
VLETAWSRRELLKVAVATGVVAATGGPQAAWAQGTGSSGVGRPIRPGIHHSPWLAAFQKTARVWENQTGNKIDHRIFTYGGLLEKTLSAA